jgi:thiol-disulfide isomerase/thioredoxin
MIKTTQPQLCVSLILACCVFSVGPSHVSTFAQGPQKPVEEAEAAEPAESAGTVGQAEDSDVPSAVASIKADVARFDAAVRRVIASLESRSRYRVDVTESWSLDGKSPSSGVNQFRLLGWHGGPFELHVGDPDAGQQSLHCHSDGTTLTRVLKRSGETIYSQTRGTITDLLDDVMTETSLRNSGLDWLFSESPAAYWMTMASDVEYVGAVDLPGGRAEHFRFNWGGNRSNQKQVWLALGEAPRLLKVVSQIEFLADGAHNTLRVESNLNWQAGDRVPEQPTSLELPADAIKVTDLYGFLLEGRTRELVGKQVPPVTGQLLDGSPWSLSTHHEKELVVVYFFSTWAAPSHAEMPAILEFLASVEPKGVVFYAVNVGEPRQIVEAFVEARGYGKHPVVLDRERQIANAFGVTSLPSVVVIGNDGVVATAHVGNTPEVRASVRESIEQLLGL